MVEYISDYDKKRAQKQDDNVTKVLIKTVPEREKTFKTSFRKFMGPEKRKPEKKEKIERIGYSERKVGEFLRSKKLDASEINVLLVIFNPRAIKDVIKEYQKVDFLDKLWIKGHDFIDSWSACRKFVKRHPKYTHIIVTSDDIIIPSHAIPMLIDDVLTYDFPVISGTCDACNTYDHENPENYGCTICKAGKRHDFISVSFKMTKEGDKPYKIVQPKADFFQWLKKDYAENYPTIHQVWFSGLALGVIRRDILLKYLEPLKVMADGTWIDREWKPFSDGRKVPYTCYSKDISLACKLHKAGIPQFADLGAHSPHLGDTHGKEDIRVGEKFKKELIFEAATQLLKEKMATYVRPVRILLCSMFNNESQSIEKYMAGLLSIDYPKKLIDLVWLENDSTDKTLSMLQAHLRKIRKKYDYHSVKLIKKRWGKKLGKLSSKKFGRRGQPTSGKNIIKKRIDAYVRGAKIATIYSIFFSLLDDCHDFLVIYMADIVPPQHALKRYLEIFRDYPDAGWVGGIHHKRFPLHYRFGKRGSSASAGGLAGPLKIERGNWSYMTDEELIEKVERGAKLFECGMTGHFWMMPRDLTRKVSSGLSSCEIVCPIIYQMWNMGYRVYCALDVYLQHVSIDGKIYRRSIYEEQKLTLKVKPDMQARLRRWLREQKLVPMPTSPEAIVKLKYEDENEEELQRYLIFIRELFPKVIPPRPRDGGEMVMDRISKNILTQEDWDRLYGKWRKFIERGYT